MRNRRKAVSLLLADMNLDCRQYNDEMLLDVTWETCTLRSWLDSHHRKKNRMCR